MIDQMSRALPEMTWLTRVQQNGYDVTIEGRCLSLTSLSDFVGNLEASRYFKRPVEIVERSGQRRQRRPRADSVHDQGRRSRWPASSRSPSNRRPARPGGQEGASQGRHPWLVSVSASCRGTRSSPCSSLLAGAGAGLFYYFYEMPEQAELADAQTANCSAIRGRISKGAAMARQLPEFRTQISELEARLEALKPILPDEKDVGDLLRRVQTLATQSNLKIRGFQPQAITTQGDARGVADQPASSKATITTSGCSSIA